MNHGAVVKRLRFQKLLEIDSHMLANDQEVEGEDSKNKLRFKIIKNYASMYSQLLQAALTSEKLVVATGEGGVASEHLSVTTPVEPFTC